MSRNHGIVPYNHDEHYEMLCGWLSARGIPNPPKTTMSEIGYVVDDLAIGFLFLTTSKIAEIDNIAADPKVSAWERDHAIHFLLIALEHEAAEAGCHLVKVLGRIPTMKKRFDRLGYESHGEFTLYYKNLGGTPCRG